jgi:hypothetical protein
VALGTAMRLAGYSDAEVAEAEREAVVDQARQLGIYRERLRAEAEAKALAAQAALAAGAPQGTPPSGGGPGGAPAVPRAAGGKELASTTATAGENATAQAA